MKKMIMSTLSKECLCYKDGKWVKDLSFINRKLTNVVVLDKRITSVSDGGKNAIITPEFANAGEPKPCRP